jgi:selenocysteine lyase/cysteine desulfurase
MTSLDQQTTEPLTSVELRADIPALANGVYMNYGAHGPIPRYVVDAAADPFTFKPGAGRFEVGSANPAPHVALGEAIETVTAVGVDHIESRIHALASRLTAHVPSERLLSPATPESGLVTVDVDDPAQTVDRLADAGIVVRSLPEPPAVRASIHAVNTEREVDRLADTLAAAF